MSADAGFGFGVTGYAEARTGDSAVVAQVAAAGSAESAGFAELESHVEVVERARWPVDDGRRSGQDHRQRWGHQSREACLC